MHSTCTCARLATHPPCTCAQLDLSSNSLGGYEVEDGYDSDGDEKTEFVPELSGVMAIADALRVNASLTEMNIVGNNIGPTGATAIKEAVRGKRGFKLNI